MKALLLAIVAAAVIAAVNTKSDAELGAMVPSFMDTDKR